MAAGDTCPCGRLERGKPLAYARCCGRYIEGGEAVPDAQALMRSRYTAFTREDAAWLLATWHPSTRPASLEFDPGAKWLGLEVRLHLRLDATHEEVEFVARQRLAGRGARLHEQSRFVLEDGRWYYVDGDTA